MEWFAGLFDRDCKMSKQITRPDNITSGHCNVPRNCCFHLLSCHTWFTSKEFYVFKCFNEYAKFGAGAVSLATEVRTKLFKVTTLIITSELCKVWPFLSTTFCLFCSTWLPIFCAPKMLCNSIFHKSKNIRSEFMLKNVLHLFALPGSQRLLTNIFIKRDILSTRIIAVIILELYKVSIYKLVASPKWSWQRKVSRWTKVGVNDEQHFVNTNINE